MRIRFGFVCFLFFTQGWDLMFQVCEPLDLSDLALIFPGTRCTTIVRGGNGKPCTFDGLHAGSKETCSFDTKPSEVTFVLEGSDGVCISLEGLDHFWLDDDCDRREYVDGNPCVGPEHTISTDMIGDSQSVTTSTPTINTSNENPANKMIQSADDSSNSTLVVVIVICMVVLICSMVAMFILYSRGSPQTTIGDTDVVTVSHVDGPQTSGEPEPLSVVSDREGTYTEIGNLSDYPTSRSDLSAMSNVSPKLVDASSEALPVPKLCDNSSQMESIYTGINKTPPAAHKPNRGGKTISCSLSVDALPGSRNALVDTSSQASLTYDNYGEEGSNQNCDFNKSGFIGHESNTYEGPYDNCGGHVNQNAEPRISNTYEGPYDNCGGHVNQNAEPRKSDTYEFYGETPNRENKGRGFSALWDKGEDMGNVHGREPVFVEQRDDQGIPADELEYLDKIGSGSFGDVYRGKWRGGVVAIKTCVDKEALKQILSEAEIFKAVRSHPNILVFYGVCTESNSECIVVEYFSGGSVYELFGKDVLNSRLKATILTSAAAGLNHLHLNSPSIIHRDIACRNILINIHEGKAVLCDFGLSREKKDNDRLYGLTEASMGPVRWLSPESINHKKYSTASDVWMFGALIMELITEDVPYSHLTNVQIIKYIAFKEELPTIRTESWPRQLKKLCLSCLRFHPDDRPSMKEILRGLTKYCAKLQGDHADDF